MDENGVSIGWKISKGQFRAMIDSARYECSTEPDHHWRTMVSGRSRRMNQAALASDGSHHQSMPSKTGTDAATRDGKRQANELSARISGLYSAVGGYTGAPTSDQRSELRFYTRMAAELGR
jgi:hypothetical protein